MNPFASTPPEWTHQAVHAVGFYCPTCRKHSTDAQHVWLNRRAPVYGPDRRKKWQEFYHCECGCVWWAWSSDRPANEYADDPRSVGDHRAPLNEPDDFFGYF